MATSWPASRRSSPRERLVEERVGEVAWLKSQLENSDEIEATRLQGYRDLERVVGILQQTQVSFNPTLGDTNQIAQETLQARAEADAEPGPSGRVGNATIARPGAGGLQRVERGEWLGAPRRARPVR